VNQSSSCEKYSGQGGAGVSVRPVLDRGWIRALPAFLRTGRDCAERLAFDEVNRWGIRPGAPMERSYAAFGSFQPGPTHLDAYLQGSISARSEAAAGAGCGPGQRMPRKNFPILSSSGVHISVIFCPSPLGVSPSPLQLLHANVHWPQIKTGSAVSPT